ncbi:MAG: DUF99 family protein [Candidatus Bathyarchaeales archaeon]
MQVVGIEDGSFKKGVTKKALLVAVLFKGLEIENVNFAKIEVDGLDATEKIVKILNEWKFDAVMLAGVSFAGFNIIDPKVLFKKFGKPVIIILRTKPDNKAIKRALHAHFKDWQIRWSVFEKLGPIRRVKALAEENPLYFEALGADAQWTKHLIKALAACGRVPEPLRVARLVARGLS